VDERTTSTLLTSAEEASAGIRGPDPKAAVERLETDYDQLLAALQWFLDEGRTEEALRLANALYRFWITKQRFEDGAFWFDRALGASGGDDQLRGAAFINAGFMPFWLGHDERAAELFSQGLGIGRQLVDASLVSQALGGLARVALRTDVAEGRRLAREALDISDAANDVAGRSNALHLLGVGAQIAGDLPEAREWMTQRLALVRSQGNEFLVASEASNLSMVERQLGNLEAAESLARESLSISQAIGDRFTVPFAFSGLASIAAERGAYERAATLLGAAEAVMEAQHMAWPPDERPHYERLLATLPESMGQAAFERARAGGRSMADAHAISFALGSAKERKPT
jgi:tetratricopeptide (TPR) repeat protein